MAKCGVPANGETEADGDTIPGQVGECPGVAAAHSIGKLTTERTGSALILAGDNQRDGIGVEADVVNVEMSRIGQDGGHGGVLNREANESISLILSPASSRVRETHFVPGVYTWLVRRSRRSESGHLRAWGSSVARS